MFFIIFSSDKWSALLKNKPGMIPADKVMNNDGKLYTIGSISRLRKVTIVFDGNIYLPSGSTMFFLLRGVCTQMLFFVELNFADF